MQRLVGFVFSYGKFQLQILVEIKGDVEQPDDAEQVLRGDLAGFEELPCAVAVFLG